MYLFVCDLYLCYQSKYPTPLNLVFSTLKIFEIFEIKSLFNEVSLGSVTENSVFFIEFSLIILLKDLIAPKLALLLA